MKSFSPKDFIVDVGSGASSITDAGIEVATKTKKPRLVARVSQFIHEWTPFLLVSSYFPFSVCLYLVCSQTFVEVFFFIYLATNFYVAAGTVLEAFFSITPIKESRQVVEKASAKNWVFPTPDSDLGMLDLILVAYLPNEKDIILDRVDYMVNKIIYPRDKIRINVLYNTPKAIPDVENDLRVLAKEHHHLRVVKVPNSTSKADNLNHFLTHCVEPDSDVIAIFDADHYPHPNASRWAMERFAQSSDIDIVQGRCIIFNSQDNFLTKMIAVEFDKIYAVSHPGRAVMWNFGLFCGSNGYWRSDLLKKLKMDGSMLTEDIDSALRALSHGANAVHDMNVTSYELAPTTWPTFWKQRLRWAQGWTQASARHLQMTWNAPPEQRPRTARIRFGIFSLLFIREWSYYLVTQCTCLTFSFVISRWPKSGLGALHFLFFQYPIAWWLFFLSVLCLVATLWITNRVKSEFVTRWDIVVFSVFYAFYIIVNATIGLYGHARQVARYSSWNPTVRS
ncbi:N-acetylglucosaminyltransferas-like protein [Pseudovirgaria hyperparasitica]|uniref:N-acetylglucosaminyltransferas-like protein n=1 Tax=Pseudovirgaria hyperparasitica TaxID=470096 RepID=A0A6A6W7A7_9PEZI|nr:N-acetylglucosaminyltransferas-like protein [Pseudovirgaria hyperparasitica]KAF2757840.1 N-acetylglucosaminyltransferas-like protein [Pseudovirgaria hyperparasitica]